MLNLEKEKVWSVTFFNEPLTSYSVGCDEVVPAIWHTILKGNWQVIARIRLFPVEFGWIGLFLVEFR